MKLSKAYQNKKRLLAVITATLLAVLLSSCASKPVVQVYPQIPAALLAHLDKTGFTGQTYGDVSKYAVILKRERDVCLNRIDKIREWQTENAQN
ncbi:Rz1-like lysis system protein LysC [Pasteurella multocida]